MKTEADLGLNHASDGLEFEMQTDILTLLESVRCEGVNPSGLKQAFLALSSICSTSEDGQDYFREAGGVDDTAKLVESNACSATVMSAALFCLACAVKKNVTSQKKVLNRTFLKAVEKLLLHSDDRVVESAAFLVACCVAGNGQGQQLINEAGCLKELLNILRRYLQCGYTDEKKWSVITKAIAVCVNNPQNERNQADCCSLLPSAVKLISSGPQHACGHHLLALITAIVANNESNQNCLRNCGGLEELFRFIKLLHKPCENKLPSVSLMVSAVSALDACVTDNATSSIQAGDLGMISVIMKFIEDFEMDPADLKTLLLAVAHILESHEKYGSQITKAKAYDQLVDLLTSSQDEELFKTIKYIFTLCKPKDKKSNEEHKETFVDQTARDFMKAINEKLDTLSVQLHAKEIQTGGHAQHEQKKKNICCQLGAVNDSVPRTSSFEEYRHRSPVAGVEGENYPQYREGQEHFDGDKHRFYEADKIKSGRTNKSQPCHFSHSESYAGAASCKGFNSIENLDPSLYTPQPRLSSHQISGSGSYLAAKRMDCCEVQDRNKQDLGYSCERSGHLTSREFWANSQMERESLEQFTGKKDQAAQTQVPFEYPAAIAPGASNNCNINNASRDLGRGRRIDEHDFTHADSLDWHDWNNTFQRQTIRDENPNKSLPYSSDMPQLNFDETVAYWNDSNYNGGPQSLNNTSVSQNGAGHYPRRNCYSPISSNTDLNVDKINCYRNALSHESEHFTPHRNVDSLEAPHLTICGSVEGHLTRGTDYKKDSRTRDGMNCKSKSLNVHSMRHDQGYLCSSDDGPGRNIVHAIQLQILDYFQTVVSSLMSHFPGAAESRQKQAENMQPETDHPSQEQETPPCKRGLPLISDSPSSLQRESEENENLAPATALACQTEISPKHSPYFFIDTQDQTTDTLSDTTEKTHIQNKIPVSEAFCTPCKKPDGANKKGSNSRIKGSADEKNIFAKPSLPVWQLHGRSGVFKKHTPNIRHAGNPSHLPHSAGVQSTCRTDSASVHKTLCPPPSPLLSEFDLSLKTIAQNQSYSSVRNPVPHRQGFMSQLQEPVTGLTKSKALKRGGVFDVDEDRAACGSSTSGIDSMYSGSQKSLHDINPLCNQPMIGRKNASLCGTTARQVPTPHFVRSRSSPQNSGQVDHPDRPAHRHEGTDDQNEETLEPDYMAKQRCPGCASGQDLNSRTYNIAIETNRYTCAYHRTIRQLEREDIQQQTKNLKLQDLDVRHHSDIRDCSLSPIRGKKDVYNFTSTDEGNLSSPLNDVSMRSVQAALKRKGCKKKTQRVMRRSRVPYSEQEIANLLEGVRTMGRRWQQILCSYNFHPSRTSIDLKDKFKRITLAELEESKKENGTLPFSMCEVRRLKRGVRTFGYNWKAILTGSKFLPGRTASDLQGKWKALNKVV